MDLPKPAENDVALLSFELFTPLNEVQVMTGDVTDPLQQLLLLSKGIVLPLLLNPANSHSMPKAMLTEATAELHRFIANGGDLRKEHLPAVAHSVGV